MEAKITTMMRRRSGLKGCTNPSEGEAAPGCSAPPVCVVTAGCGGVDETRLFAHASARRLIHARLMVHVHSLQPQIMLLHGWQQVAAKHCAARSSYGLLQTRRNTDRCSRLLGNPWEPKRCGFELNVMLTLSMKAHEG